MPFTDHKRRTAALLGLGLVALVLVTFQPVLDHDFVNFDDPLYVTANPHTRQGLSFDTLSWALTSLEPSNWQPLTLLSHSLDVELYGLDARGHHLTNLILHAAAAVALFGFLRTATGSTWRSSVVAALFAVHPLHVESIAWVAQRKDVLSGLFWFLTLSAYVRYARRPSLGRYLSVTGLFALGLTAKSMLVTLPVILLFLDGWPLERLARSEPQGEKASLRHCLVEKLPWLSMSVAVGVVTLLAQDKAIASTELVPLGLRIRNAMVSSLTYLEKTVLPTALGPFYPMTDAIPLWRIGVAAVVLLSVTGLAVREVRRRPYLTVGWLWYLVTLAPVSGLVQVGAQSHADRYTYIPLVGIFIAVVWTAADLVAERPYQRSALAAVAATVLVALALGAHRQAIHWADSVTLFRRALAVTEENPRAHLNLAEALVARRDPEALTHYRAALELSPDLADAWAGLGRTLLHSGRASEALTPLGRALDLAPDDPRIRFTFARALSANGRTDEAIDMLRSILEDRPNFTAAHRGLGAVYEERGEVSTALAHYRRALALEPDRTDLTHRIEQLETRLPP